MNDTNTTDRRFAWQARLIRREMLAGGTGYVHDRVTWGNLDNHEAKRVADTLNSHGILNQAGEQVRQAPDGSGRWTTRLPFLPDSWLDVTTEAHPGGDYVYLTASISLDDEVTVDRGRLRGLLASIEAGDFDEAVTYTDWLAEVLDVEKDDA